MGDARKLLMGFAGLLPMIAVIGLSFYLTASRFGRRLTISFRFISVKEWIALGAVLFGIAMLQIVVSVFYIRHAAREPRLATGAKVAWSLACLLVGEIAMPIYWYLYVYRDPHRS